MDDQDLSPGDVLFLEHSVSGIPWPTGYYVLRLLTEGVAIVSMVNKDAKGFYAIDNPYTISAEDLSAFSPTGVKARIRK